MISSRIFLLSFLTELTLPQIDELVSFEDFIDLVDPEANKLLAHLSESAMPLSKAVAPRRPYCVLVGPEGDFSSSELELAFEKGFQPVHLGSSRLRTETAALAAPSVAEPRARRQRDFRPDRAGINRSVPISGPECRPARARPPDDRTGHGGLDDDMHKCNIPGREVADGESERIE